MYLKINHKYHSHYKKAFLRMLLRISLLKMNQIRQVYLKKKTVPVKIGSITVQALPNQRIKDVVRAVNAPIKFNCENGTYEYYTIKINDHEPHGMLTIPQIISYSSNIGTIKIAEEVGPNIFYSFSRDFGFGQKSGISLDGEVTGRLKPVKDWSSVSLGEIAMGHEVGVTGIQLASAYAAIANGGYLLKPRLIKQVMDTDGNIVYSEESTVIRQIADEKTISEVRKMLRGVIINGTGKNADIQGWQVAGKTGTAQKWNNGQYSDDQFISNFIGFFPYENPQLLAFVMLDEPKQPYHWGAEGAAPAFRNIMSRIINMDDNIIPPIRNNDIIISGLDDKDLARNYIPPVKQSNNLPPALSSIAEYSNKSYVPDLRGLSMRRAMKTMGNLGLKPIARGSGKVLSQNLMPGSLVNKGTVCVVELQ